MLRKLAPLLISALLGTGAPTQAWAEMSIVTGQGSAIASLSRSEAERLYLGRTTTLADNSAVTLVDLPPGTARDKFYLDLTGKNPVQTRANWSRQVFTGRALPPRQATSMDELRTWLISDPHSIGYMPTSQIPTDLRSLLEISN